MQFLKRNILLISIFVCLCPIISYSNEYIKQIQEKLYSFGYLCFEEEITSFYDIETEKAFNNFKIKNCVPDLKLENEDEVLKLINSLNVIENTIDYSSESKFIKKYQQKLFDKGYYEGFINGIYTTIFEDAVKKYQKEMLQVSDGYITPVTRMTLDFKENVPHTSDDFIRIAVKREECPYVLGTQGPINYDCSGFVWWCLKQLGIEKDRIGTSLWKYEKEYKIINKSSDLIKGDLILWNTHMGIILDKDHYIDSSLSKGRICERNMSEAGNLKFICGFRIFE